MIISREAVPPYERPALSKGFLAKEKPARFACLLRYVVVMTSRLPGFLTPAAEGGVRQDETWYRDHGIEFLPNTEVTAINEQDRSVETNTGKTFQYTKLIVATGAEVIALWLALESTPAKAIRVDFKDKDGEVFYLRDLKDAELLVEVAVDSSLP